MITKILTSILIIYMAYMYYNFWVIFQPPVCKNKNACLNSYLNKSPKLQLTLFTSSKSSPIPSNAHKVKFDLDFDYKTSFEENVTINIPYQTRKNGTLYVHIFVSKYGDTWENLLRNKEAVHITVPLTRYLVPSVEVKLLHDSFDKIGNVKPVTHLKRRVEFFILADNVSFSRKEIPAEFHKYLRRHGNNEFLPILLENHMADRESNLEELDSHATNQSITLKYEPIGCGRFRVLVQMKEAIHLMYDFGFKEKDMDDIKSLSDTNFYLLMVTIGITFFHLLFDVLAFKNDIQFWRSRTSLVGLSLRGVLWRAFSQAVIALYLYEENVSKLILIPCTIDLIIQLWKVQKMVPIDCRRMKIKEITRTEEEIKTGEFDAECMKYLSYILYPLCIAGAVYSLLYQSHRSWYSWMLTNLVNGVYAFGFLFMLPQLFINYKMKSVAHLPWRNLMYKAFNTFIDDLFAFIIPVPTAHRIACFRDDIIFIIYMVQRYMYPVDISRIDEDGSICTEKDQLTSHKNDNGTNENDEPSDSNEDNERSGADNNADFSDDDSSDNDSSDNDSSDDDSSKESCDLCKKRAFKKRGDLSQKYKGLAENDRPKNNFPTEAVDLIEENLI